MKCFQTKKNVPVMTNSVMQSDPNFGGGAAGGSPFQGDFDFGDIFNSVFGGFGGFGGRQANPNAPRRGTDTETSIYISFEEAAKGCKQTITFQHVENCESVPVPVRRREPVQPLAPTAAEADRYV